MGLHVDVGILQTLIPYELTFAWVVIASSVSDVTFSIPRRHDLQIILPCRTGMYALSRNIRKNCPPSGQGVHAVAAFPRATQGHAGGASTRMGLAHGNLTCRLNCDSFRLSMKRITVVYGRRHDGPDDLIGLMAGIARELAKFRPRQHAPDSA
jgi:hypothetical protein